VVLALGSAALMIGAIAFLADTGLREREERAVEQCADAVALAVDRTSRRVRATYEYVRPSLGTALEPELESGIFRMISNAAEGAGVGLTASRETCTEVAVFPLHDRLQEQRDHCVDVLDAHRSGLAAVALDGRALRGWMGLPRTC
jgi:hypothetical protein